MKDSVWMAEICIQKKITQHSATNGKNRCQTTQIFWAEAVCGPHKVVQSQIRIDDLGRDQLYDLQSKFDEIWIQIHKSVPL